MNGKKRWHPCFPGALIMLVQLVRRSRGGGGGGGGEGGEGGGLSKHGRIGPDSGSTTETWDRQPSATMSAPAKPRCSHFPSPSSSFHHLLLLLLLLGTTSHSHKFNSTHTCSITRKPLCVFSQPNLKALTLNRDLNSSRFTGLWKQQHFGVLLLLTSGRGKGKRGRKGRTFKTRDQARKMSLMGLYERWATSRAHTHTCTHTHFLAR